ncbi:MAG: hypothetical protein JXM70_26695 [Pirellulales bacterium]|nr:hypothetical protein [Pirellulales bacterium]
MDPFRISLALGPLAVYLVVLGGMNLMRRPFVVSGTRDTAALGLALFGLILVGPFELFYPSSASSLFGPFVWGFLASLYGLSVVLVLLSQRPRLVIYNIAVEELRAIMADLVEGLDGIEGLEGETQWAGDSLSLPKLGLQLHIDASSAMRNVSLVSSGPHQNYLGWRKLQIELSKALRQFKVRRNLRASWFLLIGLTFICLIVGMVAYDPQLVAQAMMEMIQR